jgi:PHD/YefM family antitoxin component YafN of YafNO toxin-antitoxin module
MSENLRIGEELSGRFGEQHETGIFIPQPIGEAVSQAQAKRDDYRRRRAGLSYGRSDIGESVSAAWARDNLKFLVDRVRHYGQPVEVLNYGEPSFIMMSPRYFDEMLKIVQLYKMLQGNKDTDS